MAQAMKIARKDLKEAGVETVANDPVPKRPKRLWKKFNVNSSSAS